MTITLDYEEARALERLLDAARTRPAGDRGEMGVAPCADFIHADRMLRSVLAKLRHPKAGR